jgi:hypothetical protein
MKYLRIPIGNVPDEINKKYAEDVFRSFVAKEVKKDPS